MIAGQLTDEDFQRDQPPGDMWGGIAAKMDRPASEVVSIRRADRRGWFGVAAVVAAALVIAGGLLISGGDRENVVAAASLSNAGLSPLGSASSGKAEIVRRGGSYLLHIDVNRLPQEPSSYIEVWLIDTQVKGMISLGPFHGNGDYVIPSGVDPAKYPIVDVSLEPSDGVPTHSGVSIVRGVAAA
ncbi:MAG: anti-sigma factor [Ilumatobacteraceae bacterium]